MIYFKYFTYCFFSSNDFEVFATLFIFQLLAILHRQAKPGKLNMYRNCFEHQHEKKDEPADEPNELS